MTTEDLKKLAFNHDELFRWFVNDWHGHHTPEYLKETGVDEHCELHDLLNQEEDCPIKELVDKFEEVDGDWESWQQRLEDKNII